MKTNRLKLCWKILTDVTFVVLTVDKKYLADGKWHRVTGYIKDDYGDLKVADTEIE